MIRSGPRPLPSESLSSHLSYSLLTHSFYKVALLTLQVRGRKPMRERVSLGGLQNILTEQWAKGCRRLARVSNASKAGEPGGGAIWLAPCGRVCQRSKARALVFFLSPTVCLCVSSSLLPHPSCCLLAASMYVCLVFSCLSSLPICLSFLSLPHCLFSCFPSPSLIPMSA